MWNPVYFNYGIAVHGAGNVPQYPASHGCVRIPMHVGNYFPSLVAKGDQIFVFDGVKEPEEYGAQVPPFNTPDPSYTTTTSTTTTTTTTTLPPATPAPTQPPPPPTSAADAGGDDHTDHGGSGRRGRSPHLDALTGPLINRGQPQPLTAGWPLNRAIVNAAMSPNAAVSTDTWSVPGYTVRDALTPAAQ